MVEKEIKNTLQFLQYKHEMKEKKNKIKNKNQSNTQNKPAAIGESKNDAAKGNKKRWKLQFKEK